jgi:radical SAM-linked protein
MRLFERALRRAQVPVAVSEGFNPRPRMSFPMALSVGFTGRNEVADLSLHRWMRPDEIRARLQAELPNGIQIRSVEVIAPNANRQPSELSYCVPLLPGHCLTASKVDELLGRASVVATRRRKDGSDPLEIRCFIKAIRLEDRSLLLLLKYTDEGTARPQEVLEALGCQDGVDYVTSDIERTHVELSAPV